MIFEYHLMRFFARITVGVTPWVLPTRTKLIGNERFRPHHEAVRILAENIKKQKRYSNLDLGYFFCVENFDLFAHIWHHLRSDNDVCVRPARHETK